MRLPFAVALVMALMLLAASKVRAGTERVSNEPVVEVDVVLKTAGNGKEPTWSYRKAKVHPFLDGRVVICEEFKDKVEAMCIVLIDDGDVVLAPTRLLEEKT